jgi:hypothetical protein
MRQKNTVGHLEFHNQFQQTADSVKNSKWEKAEHVKRDEKQGQSTYRVKKEIKK